MNFVEFRIEDAKQNEIYFFALICAKRKIQIGFQVCEVRAESLHFHRRRRGISQFSSEGDELNYNFPFLNSTKPMASASAPQGIISRLDWLIMEGTKMHSRLTRTSGKMAI